MMRSIFRYGLTFGALLISAALASAQQRMTDTAYITLTGDACPRFKDFVVVLNGDEEHALTPRAAENGQWVVTALSLFRAEGSFASLRAGKARTYCAKSHKQLKNDKYVALFTFTCEEQRDRNLAVAVDGFLEFAYSRTLQRPTCESRDCACTEGGKATRMSTIPAVRVPDEVLLLEFAEKEKDRSDVGLNVFDNRDLGGHDGRCGAFDTALRRKYCVSKSTIKLDRNQLVGVLNEQRSGPRATSSPQPSSLAIDLDHRIHHKLRTVTLTLQ